MFIAYFGAVIAATIALFLIARKEQQHRNLAYGVTVAIPLIATVIYFAFLAPGPVPMPANEKELQQAFLEKAHSAEEKLKKEFEKNPGDTNAAMALTSSLMEQTKYGEATTIIEKAIQNNPDNANLKQQRAIIYFSHALFLAEKNKLADSLNLLKKTKEVMPKDAPYASHIDLFIGSIESRLKPKSAEENKALLQERLEKMQGKQK